LTEAGMKARAKWIEGMAFVAEAGSGHSVVLDGAPEYGGRNAGFRPMEMMLIGLAGCTAFDVLYILKGHKQDVTDCVVEVEAKRADTDPKYFTDIHLTYRLVGRNLSPERVEKAITLSKEKYCSASYILAKTARMTHSWTVEDAATSRGETA
jgi:putative redox protein